MYCITTKSILLPEPFLSVGFYEVGTSSFFGKSVTSNDSLLRHTGEGMSCQSKHVKDCFPEADTGERMFGYSRHVKGPLMKE